MKNIFLRFSVLGIVVAFVFSGSLVRAATPTLVVSPTGNGDQVYITVNGDSNAVVALYYQNTSYGQQVQTLGVLNSSGYFSTTVSLATYGITSNSSAYVIVNNQTSNSIVWPYSGYNNGYGYPNNGVSLNQNSTSLAVGQSVVIPVTGGYLPYTTYSSSPNIVQVTLSGSQLQVLGLSMGTATVNVCSSGNASACVALYVNVTQANYYNGGSTAVQSPITFSQNNLSLNPGQSVTVSVNAGGYYGTSYYVAYNSGSNNLQATMNGASLYLSGSTVGNYVVVVCSSSVNCGAVNVAINSVGIGNTGNWYQCAGENQFCAFPGTRNVRYGANGVYYYRTMPSGTLCGNNTFGDPIFGVVKSCWYGG